MCGSSPLHTFIPHKRMHTFFPLFIYAALMIVSGTLAARDLPTIQNAVAVDIIKHWDGNAKPLLGQEGMVSVANQALKYCRENSAETVPSILRKIAALQWARGEDAACLASLEEAYALSPKDLDIVADRLQCKFLLGVEPEETLRQLAMISKEFPESIEIARVVAIVAYTRKDFDASIDAGLKVLQRLPGHHSTSIVVAGSFLANDQPTKAIGVVNEALLGAPCIVERRNWQLLGQRGKCLLQLGQPDLAERILAAVWGAGFGESAVAYDLHSAMIWNGHRRDAKVFLENYFTASPGDVPVNTLLVQHLIDAGDIERARTIITTFKPEMIRDHTLLLPVQILMAEGKFQDAWDAIPEGKPPLIGVEYQRFVLQCLISQAGGLRTMSNSEVEKGIQHLEASIVLTDDGREWVITPTVDTRVAIAVLKSSIGRWKDASQVICDAKRMVTNQEELYMLNKIDELFVQRVRFDLRQPEHRKIWKPSAISPVIMGVIQE